MVLTSRQLQPLRHAWCYSCMLTAVVQSYLKAVRLYAVAVWPYVRPYYSIVRYGTTTCTQSTIRLLTRVSED